VGFVGLDSGRERDRYLLNRRRRGGGRGEEGRVGPPLLRCDVRRNNVKAEGWLNRCSNCKHWINDGRACGHLNDREIMDILLNHNESE
jgi:hypothetical protein